jgi:hypothetical protein
MAAHELEKELPKGYQDFVSKGARENPISAELGDVLPQLLTSNPVKSARVIGALARGIPTLTRFTGQQLGHLAGIGIGTGTGAVGPIAEDWDRPEGLGLDTAKRSAIRGVAGLLGSQQNRLGNLFSSGKFAPSPDVGDRWADAGRVARDSMQQSGRAPVFEGEPVTSRPEPIDADVVEATQVDNPAQQNRGLLGNSPQDRGVESVTSQTETDAAMAKAAADLEASRAKIQPEQPAKSQWNDTPENRAKLLAKIQADNAARNRPPPFDPVHAREEVNPSVQGPVEPQADEPNFSLPYRQGQGAARPQLPEPPYQRPQGEIPESQFAKEKRLAQRAGVPLERQQGQEGGQLGLTSPEWDEIIRNVGGSDYGSDVVTGEHNLRGSDGTPLAGKVELPTDLEKGLVRIAKNAGVDTGPHELLHVIVNDVLERGTKGEKAFIQRVLEQAGGEEALVQGGGNLFTKRLVNEGAGSKESEGLGGDLIAFIKARFLRNATPADLKRLAARTLRSGSGSEQYRPGGAGLKSQIMEDEQSLKKSSNVRNQPTVSQASPEYGNFPESFTDVDIANVNKDRASYGLGPLTRIPKEAQESFRAAERAVDVGRNREFTPAIIGKDGHIYAAAGHSEASIMADKAGTSEVRRGFVTRDGRFLTLMEVAKEQRAKKVRENPVPETRETIAKQLEVTLDPDSGKAVTHIPLGSEIPAKIPSGLEMVRTPKGTAIFNPTKVSRAEVLTAGQGENFDGRLLGMSQAEKPLVSDKVVTTSKDGVRDVVTEVVSPGSERAAMAAHEKAVPGGVSEVKPIADVLNERTQPLGPRETYDPSDIKKPIPYGFWIEPNGKFRPVESRGHFAEASKIADEIGLKPGMNGLQYDQLKEKGYARAHYDRDKNRLTVESFANSPNKESLIRLIKKFGKDRNVTVAHELGGGPNWPTSKIVHEATGERYQPLGPRETYGPEEKPKFSVFSGPVQRLAESSDPARQKAADVFNRLFSNRDALRGKYSGVITEINKDPVLARKAQEAMIERERTGRVPVMPLPVKRVYDVMSDTYKQMRLDQIAAGQKINGRQAGVDPLGMFTVASPDVFKTLNTADKNSPRYKSLKADYINEQISRGFSTAGAENAFNKYVEGMSTSSDPSSSVDFKAVSGAEGTKLPASWIEPDPATAWERYIDRFTSARTWHDVVEKDPSVRALFEGTDSIARDPSVTEAFNSYRGVTKNGLKGAVGGVDRAIKSVILGPVTRVIDMATTPISALKYTPFSHWPELASELTKFRKYSDASITSGLNKPNRDSYYRENVGAGEYANHVLDKAAKKISEYQGANKVEFGARVIAQAAGQSLGGLYKARALAGDAEAAKMLDKLGSDWRTISPEELGARFGRIWQGTYDARNLPAWIIDSPISPFFSMAKWSTEQWNNMIRFGVEPALRGKPGPLIQQLLISLALGGPALAMLREKMTGKKPYIATIEEIKNAPDKVAAIKAASAKIANFMQATSQLGIVGDLVNELALKPMSGQISSGGPTWPGAEITKDITLRSAKALEAVLSGADLGDVLKQYTKDVVGRNAQVWQIVNSHSEDTRLKNLARDYRVYRRLQGKKDITPVSSVDYTRSSERALDSMNSKEGLAKRKELNVAVAKKFSPGSEAYDKEMNKLDTSRQNFFPTDPMEQRAYMTWLTKTQSKEKALEAQNAWKAWVKQEAGKRTYRTK